MKFVALVTFLLAASSARAQSPSPLRPEPAPETRHVIEAGVFGGAAEIADAGDWGRVRYAVAGVTARYERIDGERHLGVAASNLVGDRYALDEPSFERFGWVARRYDVTYLGGTAGIESDRLGLSATLGLVVGSTLARTHAPVVTGAGSLVFRLGRVERLAFVVRFGSSDGWMSDRNLASLGLVHHDAHVRLAVAGFMGATMAPRLLASTADDAGIEPSFRVPPFLLIPPRDFGLRVEFAVGIRASLLGAEVSFGQQLPVGRLFVRTEFEGRVRRRTLTPPEPPSAAAPPRSRS